MTVKIGISPVSWQNDGLPDLTAACTMDEGLRGARAIGNTGVGRGRPMPADTEGLGDGRAANGLFPYGGWCSGNLLVDDVKTGTRRRPHPSGLRHRRPLHRPLLPDLRGQPCPTFF